MVDRLEWFVIMWKREAAILSVMHQVIDQVTSAGVHEYFLCAVQCNVTLVIM